MGEGYSDALCRNMGRVKRSLQDQGILANGEIDASRVRLVEGPDDVCAGCPNLAEAAAGLACLSQEKVARYDRAVREGLEGGTLPTPAQVCADCSWFSICRDL